MKNKLVKFFLIALGLAAVLPTFFIQNVFAANTCKCVEHNWQGNNVIECTMTETGEECNVGDRDKTETQIEAEAAARADICTKYTSGVEGRGDVEYKFSVSGTACNEADVGKSRYEINQSSTSSGGIKDINSYCYDAKLEGVSWIVCPTISNTTKFVDGISSFIESQLTISPELYDSKSSAATVWDSIRQIANIAMVIVLLVVIFSQVTGVGIDNYGIKKMLPRLIVMAILINLSFFICQIAIDLSNILGTSLNGLLSAAANNGLDTSLNALDIGPIILSVLAAAAGSVGVVGGIVLEVMAFKNAGAIVLFIVFAVIAILVAILIFFLAIGLRMVLAIALTVLAPLAFAAYILPNTQQLFKKWWKAFETVLLVYPICGMLWGMAKIIRSITLKSSNPFLIMVAIIAPFIPFFLLPSLLKGAVSAVGMAGNAILGMGDRWRKGVDSSTKFAKERLDYNKALQAGQDKMAAERAKKIRAAIDKREDAGKPISAYDFQRRYEAQTAINAYDQKQAMYKAGAAAINENVAAIRASNARFTQDTKAWSDQFNAQSPSDIQQAFLDALENGDSAKMVAAYNTLHSMKQFDKIYDVLNGKAKITNPDGSVKYDISRFNWNSEQANILKDSMGTSSEVILKAFSKTGHQANNVSFQDYMQGYVSTDASGNKVGQTLIETIANAKGLSNQDKATIQQLSTIQGQLTGDNASALAKMVVSNLVSNNNKPEDKEAFRSLIDKIGSDTSDFISIFSSSINGASLSGMTMKDFAKIESRAGSEAGALEIVKKAWEQANSSGNARLLAGMDNDLRAYLDEKLPKPNNHNNGPTPPPNPGPNNNNGGLPIPHGGPFE